MSSFRLDEREKAKQFAGYFKALEDRLAALERPNQLNYASIEGGSLDIYDEEGTLKGSVGVQSDGTVALVPDPVNTEPPPTPSAPTVTAALAGLVIDWDGQWADADAAPADFSLVQVHVGPAEDFTPSLTTQIATITALRGGTATVHVEGYDPVWVRLVAQNTALLIGDASVAVQGTPRQAVSQDLIDGMVTDVKLAAEAVTAAKLAAAAVTTDKVAPNAITDLLLADDAVTAAKLAAGAVESWALADGAVLNAKLAANAVTQSKLAAGAVTELALADSAVTAAKVAAAAIDSTRLADLAVTAQKIGDAAVTTAKVATGAIDSTRLADGAVLAAKLGANAVTQAKLANGAVTELALADSAVTAAKVAAAAIDSAKLADLAVTAQKIGAAAVTTGKLAAQAVTLATLSSSLADTATQRWVDTLGDSSTWTVAALGPGGSFSFLTGVTDAYTGQTVGQATGFARLRGNTQIAYDPDVLYRVSARVRMPQAGTSDAVYVGVLGIGADGTTLVNRDGVNSMNSHYYAAAGGKAVANSDGWVTVIGFLKGRAGTGVAGSAGPNNDPRSPGLVNAGVRFISPYVWLNYNQQSAAASTMQVDYVAIEALKTGVVDTINLASGAVTAPAIAADAVIAGKIAADAITARELAANSVTAAELSAGSVTAAAIAAGTITAGQLAANSVTATQLAAGSVQTAALAADAVAAGKVAADAITARELAANSVTATEISAGAVTATALFAGSVTTAALATDAVTAGKVAADAITARELAANSVTAAEIAAGVITASHIAANTITAGQLAANSVTAASIAAGSIQTAALATDAVAAGKIAADAITARELAANSVTATEISANAVTATAMAANSVTAGSISAGAVTTAAMTAGTIQGDRLAAGSVAADRIVAGSITTSQLSVTTAASIVQKMYDAGADAARWKVNGTSTTTATAPGNLTSVQVSDAQSGGYVMRAVAGFSGGWRPDILIPFDPNVLYRISFTIRQTVASSNTANQRCYAGVVGVAADGTTLVNVSGAASVASQHYVAVAAQNLTAGGGWQRFTGYLKGYAGAGVNGTQVASPTPTAPSVLHANARYISPLFYANYTGGDGTAEIGMFTIEVVETGAVQTVNIQDGAITTPKMVAGSIQGDRITAGTLNADRIVGSSITTAQLGALSVTAAQLAANSVTATAISAGAVTATAISAGSIDATHIKAGAITADRLAITGGSNMLPDPSFEGAGGAALVAGQSFWSIANTGNGSLKSAQVNAVNATAVIRTLTVATFPVLPGQAFRIATDVNPSTDWNGTSVRFYARWIDSAGGVTFGFVTNTTPTKGSWTNLAGTVTAPVGTVTAEFRLASYDATAGTVSFDNASIQPVMSDVLIADGAITANKLDAAAINGKTITGAIVQTAATGSRIVLDASKFSAYGGATATQKIVIQPDYLPLFASTPSPRIYLTSDDGTNEAYLQVNGSGDAASLYTYSGDFVDTADSNTYRWRTYMGKDTWVTERARIVTPFGAIVPDTPRISMTKIQATITAPDTYVVGTFHASSIVTGRVSITPSAANVPTSLTVTGLNINGSSPRFVATASTQVPGTSVLGVGCSDVSTSSVTIWLTRTNTTATSIDYIGMAS